MNYRANRNKINRENFISTINFKMVIFFALVQQRNSYNLSANRGNSVLPPVRRMLQQNSQKGKNNIHPVRFPAILDKLRNKLHLVRKNIDYLS